MTFQPVLIGGGNLGWTFLSKTRDAQEAAYQKSASVERDAAYFREKIGEISSAADLTGDRRLLGVALTAFGLAEDINNTFFIKRVLEDGVLAPDAFANRLSDKRYFALADAFRFDLTPPNTVLSTFPDRVLNLYFAEGFEAAVGEQDGNMRLALSVERKLNDVIDRGLSEPAFWFSVLGDPPLRRVFEAALSLPREVAGLDIDQQSAEFRRRASDKLGVESPADLTAPDIHEKLIRRFLLREDLNSAGATSISGQVALSLLQNVPSIG